MPLPDELKWIGERFDAYNMVYLDPLVCQLASEVSWRTRFLPRNRTPARKFTNRLLGLLKVKPRETVATTYLDPQGLGTRLKKDYVLQHRITQLVESTLTKQAGAIVRFDTLDGFFGARGVLSMNRSATGTLLALDTMFAARAALPEDMNLSLPTHYEPEPRSVECVLVDHHPNLLTLYERRLGLSVDRRAFYEWTEDFTKILLVGWHPFVRTIGFYATSAGGQPYIKVLAILVKPSRSMDEVLQPATKVRPHESLPVVLARNLALMETRIQRMAAAAPLPPVAATTAALPLAPAATANLPGGPGSAPGAPAAGAAPLSTPTVVPTVAPVVTSSAAPVASGVTTTLPGTNPPPPYPMGPQTASSSSGPSIAAGVSPASSPPAPATGFGARAAGFGSWTRIPSTTTSSPGGAPAANPSFAATARTHSPLDIPTPAPSSTTSTPVDTRPGAAPAPLPVTPAATTTATVSQPTGAALPTLPAQPAPSLSAAPVPTSSTVAASLPPVTAPHASTPATSQPPQLPYREYRDYLYPVYVMQLLCGLNGVTTSGLRRSARSTYNLLNKYLVQLQALHDYKDYLSVQVLEMAPPDGIESLIEEPRRLSRQELVPYD